MNKHRTILREITNISLRKWPWLLRFILIWLMLGLVSPALPRAPLEAQQTVDTTKPMVCVHTRLIDEVYEWKIQRSLQLVREMGATTIVEFFPWAYAEPQNRYSDY